LARPPPRAPPGCPAASGAGRCSSSLSWSPSPRRSRSASISSWGPAAPSCCGGCVTELVATLAWVVPALPLACAVLLQATRTPVQADRVNVVTAVATAAVALALSATVLSRGGDAPLRGDRKSVV